MKENIEVTATKGSRPTCFNSCCGKRPPPLALSTQTKKQVVNGNLNSEALVPLDKPIASQIIASIK